MCNFVFEVILLFYPLCTMCIMSFIFVLLLFCVLAAHFPQCGHCVILVWGRESYASKFFEKRKKEKKI